MYHITSGWTIETVRKMDSLDSNDDDVIRTMESW